MNQTVLDNVLGWLHKGYPEGVPPTDYFALLALLKRSLTEEEVIQAAQATLKSVQFRHGDRGRDPHRGAGRHRQGAQPRGDPPGRRAAGLRGLASGGGPLKLLAVVAPQRMGFGNLHEDQ